MAYRNCPIILQEYCPEGFGIWTGKTNSPTGSETGSETLRAKRESAINLQREMQIYKEAEEFSFDKFR